MLRRYAGLIEDYRAVRARPRLTPEQRAGLWANEQYSQRVLAATRARLEQLQLLDAERRAAAPSRRASHWTAEPARDVERRVPAPARRPSR